MANEYGIDDEDYEKYRASIDDEELTSEAEAEGFKEP